MSITSEFKEFIMRGNVIDLAVGVVIGASFGKIVDSFVKDVIMPIAGYFTGGTDFSALKITLKAADEAAKTAEVAIAYGNFINTVISFLIIGFSVFLVVKALNKVQKPVEEAPAGPTTEGLLGEIRDLLAKKK
jgi:large conductance mechanosensitive channel